MYLFKLLLACISLIIITIGVKAQQEPKAENEKVRKILWEEGVENAYPRWSNDGTKILFQSNRTGNWQLYIMNKDGSNIEKITNDTCNNNYPDWSSDNTKIAFVSDREGNQELFVMNMDGTGLINLSQNPGRDIHPYFAPDGTKLLFNSSRDDEESFEIYQVNVDGTGLKRLTTSKEVETCARISPDGKQIVYLKRFDGRNDDICVMNIADNKEINLSKSDSNEGWPVWSPDGNQVIFSSTWYGNFSLFSINRDGSNMQRISFPKSPLYDGRASISPDGKNIVFNRQAKGTIGIFILSLE